MISLLIGKKIIPLNYHRVGNLTSTLGTRQYSISPQSVTLNNAGRTVPAMRVRVVATKDIRTSDQEAGKKMVAKLKRSGIRATIA